MTSGRVAQTPDRLPSRAAHKLERLERWVLITPAHVHYPSTRAPVDPCLPAAGVKDRYDERVRPHATLPSD
jgi:hypothetical protein